MWKSIIIVSSLLLALNSATTFAADRATANTDHHGSITTSKEKMSLSEFMNSMNGYSEVEAGLIFGQEEVSRYQSDPRNNDGLGIGVGLSFTF